MNRSAIFAFIVGLLCSTRFALCGELIPQFFPLSGGESHILKEKLAAPFSKLGREPGWLNYTAKKLRVTLPKNCNELLTRVEKEGLPSLPDKFAEIEGVLATADCVAIRELSLQDRDVDFHQTQRLAPTLNDLADAQRLDPAIYDFLKLKRPTLPVVVSTSVRSVRLNANATGMTSTVILEPMARVYPKDSAPFILVYRIKSGQSANFAECDLIWLENSENKIIVKKKMDLGRCG